MGFDENLRIFQERLAQPIAAQLGIMKIAMNEVTE